MKFRISKRADADIEAIWQYIAQRSIDAANKVEEKLQDAMRSLAQFPGMGHHRSDVRDPKYRFWSVYSYLIVYRTAGKTLIVVRVIHGARDIRRLFRR